MDSTFHLQPKAHVRKEVQSQLYDPCVILATLNALLANGCLWMLVLACFLFQGSEEHLKVSVFLNCQNIGTVTDFNIEAPQNLLS